MKFIRLTSVFLCCALLSSFLILPASAADDVDYYSLPAVSDGSALVAPASLGGIALASATSWDTNDRATLNGIYKFIQYITTAPSSYSNGSIIGLLHQIYDARIPNAGSNFRLIGGDGTNDFLNDIKSNGTSLYNFVSGTNIAGNLGYIQRNTLSTADRLLNTNSLLGSVATETSLSKLVGVFATEKYDIGPRYADFGDLYYECWGGKSKSYEVGDRQSGFNSAIVSINRALTKDMTNVYSDTLTLYHYVKNLSETLASEDDRQLAENYKDNREQAEQDFLNGSSGKTSLGKDDFGSLSSVGGTFKDTISLNGQSSLADLTSGLADADTAGQGWFSQATKDSLDAVSGSGSSETTVSTFSDDGLYSVDADPDPYHMQGFEDNYAWLWGDD